MTGDEAWGATWVLASPGTDPAPLVPLLEHEGPSIRLMAAAGLVWLGDVRGFDTLVALVAVDDLVAGSHLPVPMWRYAGTTLPELTGQDLGPACDATPKEAAAAAVAWADWLEANRANLRFDATTGTWSVG